ncbi:MAG: copper oxidase (laccase) domain-containing protein [Acidimicrobiales bacterium]|jgi:polyphenol oxidase
MSPNLRCCIRSTDVRDGDFAAGLPQSELAARRETIATGSWTWLRQVHGSDVVRVDEPADQAGVEADGAFTTTVGCPISVTTADCSPVVLVGSHAVAVVHAGWRGALAGIVEKAAQRLAEVGASPVRTVLGPCIGPDEYEFGAKDLGLMTQRYGPSVVGRSISGMPALDMTEVVGASCLAVGWPQPERPLCTSSPRFFSHRARGDQGRQTTVAWLEAA